MGGFGFRRKGNDLKLFTPRMPPDVYRFIREKVHTALRQRFLIVASPIENPAKNDYGDVDVLVCWDTTGRLNEYNNAQELRKSLSAGDLDSLMLLTEASHILIERKHNSTVQLAIPWSESFPVSIAKGVPHPLAQIDLHICLSLEDFEWQLFQFSHGDIFWFLHTMVRPFGLTLGVDGLQLRIEEIEDETNDHEILLSREPSKVLEFLGLRSEGQEWDRPFESCDALFEYASTCRFFCNFGDDNISDADHKRMKCKLCDWPWLGPSARNKLLTPIIARKVYKTWVKEFVPKCRQEERFHKHVPSRKQVRKEAMNFFLGPRLLKLSSNDKVLTLVPSVQQGYHARILAFRKDQQIDFYSRVIQPYVYQCVPKVYSVNWLGNTARAFESIVMEDDHSYGIRSLKPLKTEDGLYLEPDVREFIRAS